MVGYNTHIQDGPEGPIVRNVYLPDDVMVSVHLTDEGVICDVFYKGEITGTSAEMYDEIADRLNDR